MENDEDKMLREAGVDCSELTEAARKEILRALKISTEDCGPSSSVSQDNTNPSSENEREAIKHVQSGNVLDTLEKSYDSHSSNSNNSFKEKDVSKPKIANYANTVSGQSSSRGGSRQHKPENKPAPGAAVPVKDSDSSTQSNNLVWLEKSKKKENGVSRKSLSLPPKEDPVETESSEAKENTRNSPNRADTSSPLVIEDEEEEEEVQNVVPLMQLILEKHNSTSFMHENAFLPPSLPRDEWIKQAGQYFFTQKTERIKAEARQNGSKWVTLFERTYTLTPESVGTRSSPSHTKDDNASNSETLNMDTETSNKARTSPEISGDNVRESSPEIAVLDNSPRNEINSLDAKENAAIALPDSSNKYGKADSPQNSPLGRGGDDAPDEQAKRRSNRNRNSRGKKNNRGAMSRSGSTGFNEDNSNGSQSPYSAKNNEKEYSHNNADFPAIGDTAASASGAGSPYSDNNVEKVSCPMCERYFSQNDIQNHAWNCVGSEKEVDRLVAGRKKKETGRRRIHRWNLLLHRDSDDDDKPSSSKQYLDDSSDDSDPTFEVKTSSRKRNTAVLSSDDEIPPKTAKK